VGLTNHTLTPERVKRLLDRTATEAGLTDAGGAALRFTPHDFRRIFATEAVATGLPPSTSQPSCSDTRAWPRPRPTWPSTTGT